MTTDPSLAQLIGKFSSACFSCARSGIPLLSKTFSPAYIDSAFNNLLKADSVYCVVSDENLCVLHSVDAGTSYSEVAVTTSRPADAVTTALEAMRILRHEAPRSFSIDPDFQTRPIRRFLSSHSLFPAKLPVRGNNKTGVVEKKNLTLKRITERLKHDDTKALNQALIFRASFQSNVFSGSGLMVSFELDPAYTPAVLALPQSIVSESLLESYRDQLATRALQQLHKSRTPSTVPSSMLPEFRYILFFY